MKKTIIYLFAVIIGFSFMTSCEDYPDQPVTPPNNGIEQGPVQDADFKMVLKGGASPYVITKDNLIEPVALTTVTSLPDLLDEEAQIEYLMQISTTENFASPVNFPVTLFDGTVNSDVSVNTSELNDILLEFANNTEPRNVYLRMVMTVLAGGTIAQVSSDVLPFQVTPYINPMLQPLYLVGNLITGLPTWDNSVAGIGNGLQVMFSDVSTADFQKYTYTAHFDAAGEAKFPLQAGVWDPAWGWNSTDSKMELVNNSGNLPGPAADGYYTLTVDLINLTAVYTPYDASAAVTYTSMGLVGDATPGGWDADTQLTQVAPHIWVLASVDLTVGELKIRANGGWDNNWGIPDGEEMPYGIAGFNVNAPNFKITAAGTYYIALNDLTNHYIVIPRAELP